MPAFERVECRYSNGVSGWALAAGFHYCACFWPHSVILKGGHSMLTRNSDSLPKLTAWQKREPGTSDNLALGVWETTHCASFWLRGRRTRCQHPSRADTSWMMLRRDTNASLASRSSMVPRKHVLQKRYVDNITAQTYSSRSTTGVRTRTNISTHKKEPLTPKTEHEYTEIKT